MPKVSPEIRSIVGEARVFEAPFPYAIIDHFMPEGLFKNIAADWPSDAMYPVPMERANSRPRRRHIWLSELVGRAEIDRAWVEIARIFRSNRFRSAARDLLARCGEPLPQDVACISRLCEEELPYRLEKHRDHDQKIASLIWYIDTGPGHRLATLLHGRIETKAVPSRPNSALFLPNTATSYHSGDWLAPEGHLRRTVQVFFLAADPVGAEQARPSRSARRKA